MEQMMLDGSLVSNIFMTLLKIEIPRRGSLFGPTGTACLTVPWRCNPLS